MLSGVLVTVAPSYPVLVLGRALLGVSIGGFWSMSTAIVMRLVDVNQVPKALALLNAGNAIAATISAPLGSLLGAYIGWRGAFFLVVPVALLALIWQSISLPGLPPRREGTSVTVFRLLGRPPVALGMTAILLLFIGQFALHLSPAIPGNGNQPRDRTPFARSSDDGPRRSGRHMGYW